MPDLSCPCGEVHELPTSVRAQYDAATEFVDPLITVTIPGGSWLVPRIYIAAHGLRGADLPALAGRYGFERAEQEPPCRHPFTTLPG